MTPRVGQTWTFARAPTDERRELYLIVRESPGEPARGIYSSYFDVIDLEKGLLIKYCLIGPTKPVGWRPFLIVSAPTTAVNIGDAYGALSLETGNLVQVSYWVLLEALAQGKRIA